MRNLLVLSMILASSLTVSAQTAKVIQLSPEDAQLARQLYDQKAEIESKIVDLQQKIEAKYFTSDAGWPLGFEYSTDFKFIVPKTIPVGTGNISIPYVTEPRDWVAPAINNSGDSSIQ